MSPAKFQLFQRHHKELTAEVKRGYSEVSSAILNSIVWPELPYCCLNYLFVREPWWRHQMETCSALLALNVGNSPPTGEFPSLMTRSFDVFFDLRLNKPLSKQSRRRWFQTPSRSIWRHCNVWSRITLYCNAWWRLVLRHVSVQSWWRHQMETFSSLLALCAGNSPVPVNSPHKGQWRGALMFSLICARINDWVNNREAGSLRRHLGHYDVNVMNDEWVWDP